MGNSEKLISLYKLYGFELLEEEKEFLVFSHKEGYFINAEIVCFEKPHDLDAIQKDLEQGGYSVRVGDFESLESSHRKLFHGFFAIEESNRRLMQEYKKFCEQQSKRLINGTYSFIPCKFVGDENIIKKDVVNTIYQQIFADGPQLIIVEAAAGFGKTCTSYEVIRMLAENSRGTVPIITELSKNRRAALFRYVLLSEIDAKFRGLTSELVKYEIKNGLVPLIIDGFDELLSKSISEEDSITDEDNETAQTMLGTIAQLLSGNSQAKIVLTSRKSSIFAGTLFTEWVDKVLPECQITRLQLVAPTAEEWIGEEKAEILTQAEIDLANIANPALLSFIASSDISMIQEEFKTGNDILKKYFEILLKREKERQALLLSVEEQLCIMEQIALSMVGFDVSSFDREDLAEILEFSILTEEDINGYLERYEENFDASESIPTKDEFIAKLAHHALLDRIPNTSNTIGFVNEFIFGYLLANAIVQAKNKSPKVTDIKFKYWDLMTTSFSVTDEGERRKLYQITQNKALKFSPEEQLNIDLLLLRKLTRNYTDQYFEAVHFEKNIVICEFSFIGCTFSYCIFDGCVLASDTFKNCMFYGCQFYNVNVRGKALENCNLIFSNCIGEEDLKSAAMPEKSEICFNEDERFEKMVLEQYWKPGSDRADKRRVISTLFKGYNPQDYDGITKAIERLVSKKILFYKNSCIELNFSQMREIKRIIGR